ncbi:MAG: hypothetical protein GOMPHAMPRED_002725 [Gomphillus americanus]|uniref:Uncharacterized protein n=1 Tax=Gomphillus americanus TaxID=1940652 RepID=A0A8H3FL95_9LECA|nr:MAG: hypothetical protein GOMPHAMPRED_002725 [Gomphillus americanus]
MAEHKPNTATATDQGSSGGISETINQGVEYLQSAVTGTGGNSGQVKPGDKVVDDPKTSEDSTASAAGIDDENVAEMLRDKYKSKTEEDGSGNGQGEK